MCVTLSGMTNDDLKAIQQRYLDTVQRALEERDEGLRAAIAAGRQQVDIIKATGLSRETVRLALDPNKRDQLRNRRRKTTPERLAA